MGIFGKTRSKYLLFTAMNAAVYAVVGFLTNPFNITLLGVRFWPSVIGNLPPCIWNYLVSTLSGIPNTFDNVVDKLLLEGHALEDLLLKIEERKAVDFPDSKDFKSVAVIRKHISYRTSKGWVFTEDADNNGAVLSADRQSLLLLYVLQRQQGEDIMIDQQLDYLLLEGFRRIDESRYQPQP